MFNNRFYAFSILVLMLCVADVNPVYAQKKSPAIALPSIDTSVISSVEVINIGYSVNQRKYITGAVSGVPGNRIKELAPVSVDALLQGQSTGLQVVNTSGAPGSGALTIIRGSSTLNAGSLPLYIVDGVPVKVNRFSNSLTRNADNNPLADINPQDIASITVLKDAQATAIYGMRGANGVIIINTTAGTAGKTYLDFSGYTGIMQAPEKVPVLNPDQYRAYIIEKEVARGLTQAEIDNGVGRYLLLSTPANQVERYNNNTDWQDMVLRNGFLNNYHLNLRGGDAIAKYSLNIGYTNQTGVIENTDFSRFSTRFNLDYKVGRKLSFLNSLSYTRTDRTLKDEGNSFNTNPLYLAALKSPTLTAFQQNVAGEDLRDLDSADYAGRSNPYSVINRMRNENNTNRISGKIIGQYVFSPNLKLQMGIAADYFRLDEARFRPSAGFLPEGYIIRASSEGKSTELMLLNENILTYTKALKGGKHAISAFVGNAIQMTSQDAKAARAVNSTSDEFSSINTSDPLSIDSIYSSSPSWKLLSFFGNAQYTLENKYIFSASLRADGSSRFAEGNRWGYFPSVAAAWRIGAEPFLQHNRLINDLKLRASYGITGNQEVGYYNAYNALIAAPYSNYSSVRFGILGNPDFKWEETKQFNAGMDMELLSGRLGVSLDFYVKKTSNLFNVIKLPGISGFESYAVSEGSVRNRGIEISVSSNVLKGALTWQAGLVATYNQNRVLSLPDKLDAEITYGDYSGIVQVGSAIGAFYGYNATGVYASNAHVNLKNGEDDLNPFRGGDIIFEDVDKNGIIDEKDRKVIGNTNPDLFGGFSNIFSYKNFDLTVFVDFASGNEVYNAQRASLESMSTYDNQSTTINNRWRNDGDVTDMPRLLHGDPVGNTRFSSRWLEDGSYVRFKAVTFGYNLPLKGYLKGVFKNARVLLSAQNLYTFTRYRGYSPEAGSINNTVTYGADYANIPQLKTFVLGVRLGL
jgi:TonB-dependent starch-binding outer membrane protein SusC